MLNFLRILIQFLEKENISYMLSGSVALSIYTLPRATRDFDFVVQLLPKDVEDLISNFNEGYYCDEDAVKDAIKNHSMFNIIDHASGFKADFMVLKNEVYRQTEFDRRLKADFFDIPIYVVTPEDLLISKLIWIQEIKSSLQMEDIRKWLQELKLNTYELF